MPRIGGRGDRDPGSRLRREMERLRGARHQCATSSPIRRPTTTRCGIPCLSQSGRREQHRHSGHAGDRWRCVRFNASRVLTRGGIDHAFGDHWFWGAQGLTSATLGFTFSNLPPGTYSLTAYANPDQHNPPRDFGMSVGAASVAIVPVHGATFYANPGTFAGTIRGIAVDGSGSLSGSLTTIAGDPSIAAMVLRQVERAELRLCRAGCRDDEPRREMEVRSAGQRRGLPAAGRGGDRAGSGIGDGGRAAGPVDPLHPPRRHPGDRHLPLPLHRCLGPVERSGRHHHFHRRDPGRSRDGGFSRRPAAHHADHRGRLHRPRGLQLRAADLDDQHRGQQQTLLRRGKGRHRLGNPRHGRDAGHPPCLHGFHQPRVESRAGRAARLLHRDGGQGLRAASGLRGRQPLRLCFL